MPNDIQDKAIIIMRDKKAITYLEPPGLANIDKLKGCWQFSIYWSYELGGWVYGE